MEFLLILLGLLAAGYAVYRLAGMDARKAPASPSFTDCLAKARADAAHRSALRAAEVERKRRYRLHRQNGLARALQVALVQLPKAPDFRRAATFAAHAHAVPVAFRHKVFRRFRPRLLAHLVSRLRAGANAGVLTESLAELLEHLGVSGYEAEYLRQEAERRIAPPSAPSRPAHAQRLAQVQHAHEQRLPALQAIADEELREELLEAEQIRFREEMRNAVNDNPNPPAA